MLKLNAPTQSIWLIAVICGCLGLLSHFVHIPQISGNELWLVAVGFVLLVLSTVFKKF